MSRLLTKLIIIIRIIVMSSLSTIIRMEYLMEVRRPGFWISTFAVPAVVVAVIIVYLFMTGESSADIKLPLPSSPARYLSAPALGGLFSGIFLTFFLAVYGSQIHNKVKTEKCNRMYEILVTCVAGRTMMLAKIISVGLIGLTQIAVWMAAAALAVYASSYVVDEISLVKVLADPELYRIALWNILFFIGGYIFYGSLFAASGALTDRDNENQTYMTLLTFLLLGSFYVGEFAVGRGNDPLIMFFSFLPFTSPTVSTVNAIAGDVAIWQSLLSLAVLYLFAYGALMVAGKLYTSAMLLKGKQISPKDIWVFLRSK